MLYLPRHLLGLETATSVLKAALHGVSSGGLEPRPHYDLAARADRNPVAGSILDIGGHHHIIDGISAELHPAPPLAPRERGPVLSGGACPPDAQRRQRPQRTDKTGERRRPLC
jgi:hypothetical protein